LFTESDGLCSALITLFDITTGDGWPDAIPKINDDGYAALRQISTFFSFTISKKMGAKSVLQQYDQEPQV
jgi:hypothetical protein